MLQLIRSLFCFHDWETIDTRKINLYSIYYGKEHPVESKHIYIQKCIKCSKMRKYQFKIF